MADFEFVQQAGNVGDGSGAIAATFGADVLAGSMLVAAVTGLNIDGTSTPGVVLTDTQFNLWEAQTRYPMLVLPSNYIQTFFLFGAQPGATTVTATFNDADLVARAITVVEFVVSTFVVQVGQSIDHENVSGAGTTVAKPNMDIEGPGVLITWGNTATASRVPTFDPTCGMTELTQQAGSTRLIGAYVIDPQVSPGATWTATGSLRSTFVTQGFGVTEVGPRPRPISGKGASW